MHMNITDNFTMTNFKVRTCHHDKRYKIWLFFSVERLKVPFLPFALYWKDTDFMFLFNITTGKFPDWLWPCPLITKCEDKHESLRKLSSQGTSVAHTQISMQHSYNHKGFLNHTQPFTTSFQSDHFYVCLRNIQWGLPPPTKWHCY